MKATRLTVRRGSFVLETPALDFAAGGTALLGPNGAGKTTLLLALQGLIPASGSVDRAGRSAAVFAQPAVLRGTAAWNVSIACRRALGMRRPEADRRAAAALRDAGLAHALDANARTLSTGQRQRLGIARALALEPEVLFLDEPLANVDADGRPALRALVRAYAERRAATLVVATSSLADAVALCENAVVLREGRVTHAGSTASLREAADPYIAALRAEAGMAP